MLVFQPRLAGWSVFMQSNHIRGWMDGRGPYYAPAALLVTAHLPSTVAAALLLSLPRHCSSSGATLLRLADCRVVAFPYLVDCSSSLYCCCG